MKIATPILRWAVCVFGAFSAQAQGTFQNFDFEQANPIAIVGSPFYPTAVTVASALPGWTASIGGVPAAQVFLNNYSTGSASIDIFGPGEGSVDPGVIDGGYTVFLQSGFGFEFSQDDASLSQEGTIPLDANSLEFKAWNVTGYTPLAVSFAGNNLPLVILSSGESITGQPYNVFGANLTPFQNQTGLLEFDSVFINSIELDDISFSPLAVSEPSPLILSGFGAILFASHRRFVGKRREA